MFRLQVSDPEFFIEFIQTNIFTAYFSVFLQYVNIK